MTREIFLVALRMPIRMFGDVQIARGEPTIGEYQRALAGLGVAATSFVERVLRRTARGVVDVEAATTARWISGG
jgi:hypothetical protein